MMSDTFKTIVAYAVIALGTGTLLSLLMYALIWSAGNVWAYYLKVRGMYDLYIQFLKEYPKRPPSNKEDKP